jgi:CRP-like cAMP-binding protein
MPLSDHERLIRSLQTIAEVGEQERALLRQLPFRQRQFAENSDIVSEGAAPSECCLILEGMAARYAIVSGGRRQILSFHFSGDLPDLQGLQLEHMDHGIYALTPVRAAFIPHAAVRGAIHTSAKLNDVLVRHALIDASIFRQWIANVGRRTALERIAHIFCEVFVRMSALGLVEKHRFSLPITQAELGDAAGLSPVHVNRVLQRMRGDGLIASRGDVHEITDWQRLRRAGDFNADYLHLKRAGSAHDTPVHAN